MSYENPLRRAATEGRFIRGAWIASASATIAEAVASVGYDYVGIDLQHGIADLHDAVPMIAMIAGQGVTPMVRVPANDAAMIGRVLDIGALGIIVPLVDTPEQAAAAVAATRYPPLGNRSYGPVRAATAIGSRETSDLEQIFVAVMVETRAGLTNVEAIAATPGLDAVYVGPSDLALGLGLPPAYERAEQEHIDAIERIRRACEVHGIVAAIHCADGAMAWRRRAQGFGLTTVVNDIVAVRASVERELRRVDAPLPDAATRH